MRLSITMPRGALVETEVDEVTAPGVLGEFGVLPGHVPLMSALKPGVLVYRAKDRVGVVAVGQGFLQVAPVPTATAAQASRREGDGDGAAAGSAAAGGGAPHDRVLVLVDQALAAGSIDRQAAERDLAQADRALAEWKRDLDSEYQALLVRRSWAAARVDAAARAAAH
jgi:F-type H+-transporting ATPase subunit epsilon